jgi:hypothetical protein
MKLATCARIVSACWGAAALADGVTFELIDGTGAPEDNGAAGPTRTINIGEPFGVEFGPHGALQVGDTLNHVVRRAKGGRNHGAASQ